MAELRFRYVVTRTEINVTTDCWRGHVCFEKLLRMGPTISVATGSIYRLYVSNVHTVF